MPPPDEGLNPDAAAEEIVDLHAHHDDAWAEARGGTLPADEAVHLTRFLSCLPVGARFWIWAAAPGGRSRRP